MCPESNYGQGDDPISNSQYKMHVKILLARQSSDGNRSNKGVLYAVVYQLRKTSEKGREDTLLRNFSRAHVFRKAGRSPGH